MAGNEIGDRLRGVREVTDLFKVERFVYVSAIVVSLLILLVSVTVSLVRGEIGSAEVSVMMTSGGSIAFMTGRLIHMWNRAIDLLARSNEQGKGES